LIVCLIDPFGLFFNVLQIFPNEIMLLICSDHGCIEYLALSSLSYLLERQLCADLCGYVKMI
jgi:hypothetical protein